MNVRPMRSFLEWMQGSSSIVDFREWAGGFEAEYNLFKLFDWIQTVNSTRFIAHILLRPAYSTGAPRPHRQCYWKKSPHDNIRHEIGSDNQDSTLLIVSALSKCHFQWSGSETRQHSSSVARLVLNKYV